MSDLKDKILEIADEILKEKEEKEVLIIKPEPKKETDVKTTK